MAGHVLGMARMVASVRGFVGQNAAASRAGGGIDALTALQVRRTADLSTGALVEQFAAVGPRAVRGRRRLSAVLGRLPVPEEQVVGGRDRALAVRLPLRRRPDPGHLDAPDRRLPGDRAGAVPDGRPRRRARRRRRRGVGGAARPALPAAAHRPGRGRAGRPAPTARRSSSTPWSSAGCSPGAARGPGCWRSRCPSSRFTSPGPAGPRRPRGRSGPGPARRPRGARWPGPAPAGGPAAPRSAGRAGSQEPVPRSVQTRPCRASSAASRSWSWLVSIRPSRPRPRRPMTSTGRSLPRPSPSS